MWQGASGGATRARHHLTILFCDLCDSTLISGRIEAEEYDELLGGLREIASQAVERHGGEIVRIDGDGMAAIFGHPVPHEDDGRRAVEAALDIHLAARRMNVDIPGAGRGIQLHSGIHSGLVLLKQGDLVRGRFEMPGETTNIAARLTDLAGPDEILVSEASLGSDLHFFKSGERRQAGLSGRDEPIAVYRIFGRQGVDNRFAARARRGLTRFTGRRRELERLDARLRGMAAGDHRLAVLVGPAGLGKTRLANEFLERAEASGFRVHRGFCEAYLGARTLQPFLQILPSVIGETEVIGAEPDRDGDHGALVRRISELLQAASGAAGAGSLADADPVSVIAEFFAHRTRHEPMILFIDDWQWADDISRRVLDHLRRGGHRGLFLLLAARRIDDLDVTSAEADVIDLAPLSEPERAATIGAMLAAPEPFLVERIAEASGGNPLLIEELCHTYRQASAPARPGSAGAWLDMLIESRFARLTPARAATVKAAAVVGTMIPDWLFEDVTGVAADGPVVAELAADDFIYPSAMPGMLQFKHGITRDAIYSLIDLKERRAAHANVVRALRARARAAGEPEPLEALAYHLQAAGALAEAARYAEWAGDAAMAASSLDRAQAQYSAALGALDNLPDGPETARWDIVARKYAQASIFDPMREQLPVLRRLRERAVARGAPGDVAFADYWLGVLCYGLGQSRQSIRHCRLALGSATAPADDKLSVEIRATLGRAYAIACDYQPALALLNETIDLRRRRPRRYLDVALMYSIASRAFLLADMGRFEDAYDGFDEAIGALDGALHQVAASIQAMRSGACLWHGRMDAAALYAAEAERVARQVKARYLYSIARALGGYARWSTDRSAESLAVIVESTAWLEASDSQQRISLAHGWLTEAMSETGDMDSARRHARLAVMRARQGDRLGEAMAYRALARAAAKGWGTRSPQHYLDRATAAANARQSAHELLKTRLCAAEIAGAPDGLRAAGSALRAMNLDWFARPAHRQRAIEA